MPHPIYIFGESKENVQNKLIVRWLIHEYKLDLGNLRIVSNVTLLKNAEKRENTAIIMATDNHQSSNVQS